MVTIFTGSDLVEGLDTLVFTFSALGFLISLFDFCWLLAISATFAGEKPTLPCHRMRDVLASIRRGKWQDNSSTQVTGEAGEADRAVPKHRGALNFAQGWAPIYRRCKCGASV